MQIDFRLEIILVILGIYAITTTLIGVRSAKYNKDTATFMTAKNLMGPFVVGILMMSEFIGVGSTLGTAQTAFMKGISAGWNLITLGVGFLLYAYLAAPRVHSLQEYTISGVIGKKYGLWTQSVVSLTMMYALITIMVASYTGGAATIASLVGIPIKTSIFVIAIISMLIVSIGGMRGVGYTNLFHAAFKYISLIIITIFAWNLIKVNPKVMTAIPKEHFSLTGIGVSTIVAWTVANIGSVFSTQYVVQSLSSLNNETEAKKASLIASVSIVPIGFFASYIGIASKALHPNINSVMAIPIFLKDMNPYIAGITICGIFAATFVTILACIVGTSALFMKDVYIPLIKPDKKHELIATRLVTVLIGLIPIPFALYVPMLLKTVFFARALRTIIAVILVFMLFLPHIGSSRSATIAIIASVVATTIWFALGNPFGIDNIFVAIVVPAAIMFLGCICKKYCYMRAISNDAS